MSCYMFVPWLLREILTVPWLLRDCHTCTKGRLYEARHPLHVSQTTLSVMDTGQSTVSCDASNI